jgi:hypothetical protein
LKVAIDTIDASADFIAKTKRILLVPVLHFFITLIVVLIWVTAMTCVISLNDFKPSPEIIPQTKDLQWNDPKVQYMSYFMFFGILWVLAWVNYTNDFIAMVSVATYYFDSNHEREGEADVGLGFKFAYVNHIGSISCGAFIIAVI